MDYSSELGGIMRERDTRCELTHEAFTRGCRCTVRRQRPCKRNNSYALPNGESFREVYKQLYEQKSSVLLRFQGIGTDGGVDSSGSRQMLYWVDNMFVADHLEVYCSELGKGIAVFASLQSGEARQDRERKERVEFLREVLREPLRSLLPVNETGDYMHRPLESWSLTDLERFLTELWTNGPQPPGEPGPWLRESVAILANSSPGASEFAIMSRVQKIVHSFQARFMADTEEEDPSDTPDSNNASPARLQHEIYRVVADPDNRNAIIDADLMPALLAGPSGGSHTVGLISHIEVNRKGGAFSCPVRTGALLSCVYMGSSVLNEQNPASSSAEPCSVDRRWFQGMALLESSAMTVLRNCLNFTALQQHISDRDLPPQICVHVHRGRNHFQGVTVEFEAIAQGTPQFFSADEDQALREWEASVLGHADVESTNQGTVKPLPTPLAWVKQYFDPHHPGAGGYTRDEIEEFESWDSSTFKSAENACSSQAASDEVDGESEDQPCCSGVTSEHTSTAAMQQDESAAAGTDSRGSAEEFASGASDSDSETESEEWVLGADEVHKTTCGRHKLKLALQQHRPANLMCAVLADQENLMRYWEDDHPHPNIDISFVKFTGREVTVPCGAQWCSRRDCRVVLD